MKQILQNLNNGSTFVVDAPTPQNIHGHLIVGSSISLISAGTERMLVDFGKSSVLKKIQKQPEKVKMVAEKIQTDGLLSTIDAVRSKLETPIPLGYSNVGVIESIGEGVSGFKVGDRVVSNGAHAEIIRPPKNLCAKIPDNVSDEEAAFTVVSSIGLQGIRLAGPTLGENFVVSGVGLIGLLTVQLLKAQGCRVLAIDFDENKLALARTFGAETCNLAKGEDPITAGQHFSRQKGVDGVIITASTDSNDPVSTAAKMCRKRGRIILVGVTGLSLNRSDFYEKELSFQVSCSYGPGRYDQNYEEKGHDYPYGLVRWTEQRNFEAVLDMMSEGKLNIKPLITHQYDIDNAQDAYNQLLTDTSTLGILINYKRNIKERKASTVKLTSKAHYNKSSVSIGFIGAGNYSSRVLIPAFKKSKAKLHTISTSSGITAVNSGKNGNFIQATTDNDDLLKNPEINTVVITTRHNSHARFVCSALEHGKNVFVEKPLCLNSEELNNVRYAYKQASQQSHAPKLMVGFNRRFAPHTKIMKSLLSSIKEPKSFIFSINAGLIPQEHWTQDKNIGGGRIIGEACHFIDLMRFLTGYNITSIQCISMGASSDTPIKEDNTSILLGFADGSIGCINYFANGSAKFPKERLEVFCEGKVLQLDNFRKLTGYGWKGFKYKTLWRQDKGQNACINNFVSSIEQGSDTPIAIDEIFEVAKASIKASELVYSKDHG